VACGGWGGCKGGPSRAAVAVETAHQPRGQTRTRELPGLWCEDRRSSTRACGGRQGIFTVGAVRPAAGVRRDRRPGTAGLGNAGHARPQAPQHRRLHPAVSARQWRAAINPDTPRAAAGAKGQPDSNYSTSGLGELVPEVPRATPPRVDRQGVALCWRGTRWQCPKETGTKVVGSPKPSADSNRVECISGPARP
jgi:hypothetical protein